MKNSYIVFTSIIIAKACLCIYVLMHQTSAGVLKLQDFNFTNGGKRRTVQVSPDIQNFGNLVSSKWGVRKYAATSGFYQPLAINRFTDAGALVFTFDPRKKIHLCQVRTLSPDGRCSLDCDIFFNGANAVRKQAF